MNHILPFKPWLDRVLVGGDDVDRIGAGKSGNVLIHQFADELMLAHVFAEVHGPERNPDDGRRQDRCRRRPAPGASAGFLAGDGLLYASSESRIGLESDASRLHGLHLHSIKGVGGACRALAQVFARMDCSSAALNSPSR